MSVKKHGGVRAGAGRPTKGRPIVDVSVRLPRHIVDQMNAVDMRRSEIVRLALCRYFGLEESP